ncbi:MAG: hypothetical protein Q4C95_12235 [Planctomycetia bacterium]|nr:hypothetical protein [Planctomycetia bacterium]
MKINLYSNNVCLTLLWGIIWEIFFFHSLLGAQSILIAEKVPEKQNESLMIIEPVFNSDSGNDLNKQVVECEFIRSKLEKNGALNPSSEHWIDDGVPFLPDREKDILESLFLLQRINLCGSERKISLLINNQEDKTALQKRSKSLKGIGFIQLKQQSSAYKGQMITIQGRLLKTTFIPFNKTKNILSKKDSLIQLNNLQVNINDNNSNNVIDLFELNGFYESWVLLDDEPKIPARLLTLSIPNGLPLDSNESVKNEYRQERIYATGIYYRQTAFFDGSDFFNSPTILADSFQLKRNDQSQILENQKKETKCQSFLRETIIILLILVWLSLRFGLFKKNKKTPLSFNRTDSKASRKNFSWIIIFLTILFWSLEKNAFCANQSTQNNQSTQFILNQTAGLEVQSEKKINGNKFNETNRKNEQKADINGQNNVISTDFVHFPEIPGISEMDWSSLQTQLLTNFSDSEPFLNLSKFHQATLQTLFRLNQTIPASFLMERLKTTPKNNFAQKGVVSFRGKLIQIQKINLSNEEKERYRFSNIYRCVIRPIKDAEMLLKKVNGSDNVDNLSDSNENDIIVYTNKIPTFDNGFCSLRSNQLDGKNGEIIVGGLGLYLLDIISDWGESEQNCLLSNLLKNPHFIFLTPITMNGLLKSMSVAHAKPDITPINPLQKNVSRLFGMPNLKSSYKTPIIMLDELAWFSDDSLLGKLGMNLALFDDVVVYPVASFERDIFLKKKKAEQKLLLNSLRLTENDRFAFYEMLDVSKRLTKGKLIQIMKNIKKKKSYQNDTQLFLQKDQTSNSEDQILFDYFIAKNKKQAETSNVPNSLTNKNSKKQSNAAKFLLSSTELFQKPEQYQGIPVYLKGTVKRASLILINDPEIKKRFGMDHYYQLFLFADDSQGKPLILNLPELPEGMPVGISDDYREEIEFAGFFYKTWAYQTSKKTSSKSSNKSETGAQIPPKKAGEQNNSNEWIRSPLLIGQDLIWHSQENLPVKSDPFSKLYLIISSLILLLFAGIVYRHLTAKKAPIIFRIQDKTADDDSSLH